MIEITTLCTVALMKEDISCLFDVERNLSTGNKTEDGEFIL